MSYCSQLSAIYITSYQAVTQFTILADESNAVPSLTNQRSYLDFHLTQRDWEHLVDIRDVLRVSGTNHITSILTTSPLGAIKYPADVLKWACAHCVAHYSQLWVPSLSSIGKAWLLIKNTLFWRMHSVKVSRTFTNGMTMLRTHLQRILFALVRTHAFLYSTN